MFLTDSSSGGEGAPCSALIAVPSPHPTLLITGRALFSQVMKKCLTLGAKKVFYIPADMSSPSEPDRVVQFAVQNLGKQNKNGSIPTYLLLGEESV